MMKEYQGFKSRSGLWIVDAFLPKPRSEGWSGKPRRGAPSVDVIPRRLGALRPRSNPKSRDASCCRDGLTR
jgi:hypothetical protein